MSKTVELARHLETLHINNMYKTDFYWTWDKTDEEIDAVFTVADALRDLRERNKNTKIFNSGLGISIFRDNSTRTRFSFASACNLLGLEEQVLDEKKSQIAHGETVRETANMVSFMADVIGIRDDMYIHQGHEYQKTFMDALEEGYRREHKRKPRFTKITMVDKLILTLTYRCQYRSMDSIAKEYEVSLDTISDNIHWVEQTLLNADLLESSVTCVYKTNAGTTTH